MAPGGFPRLGAGVVECTTATAGLTYLVAPLSLFLPRDHKVPS